MGNKFISAAGDNPLLKVVPPADRRGAQMKAPSERAPRGKYAGGVLECGMIRRKPVSDMQRSEMEPARLNAKQNGACTA